MSSACLKLLIFLPAILIPACASSSPACHMMYSAYKLNNQGNSIQAWHTPFPILNQSVVPCLVLTVASWPAYRFLKVRLGKQFMVQPYKQILFSHRILIYININLYIYICMHAKSLQSCPTLYDPLDCSLIHGILQARMLEWVAIAFSRGSSRPSDQTCISALARGFFTTNTTWESFILNIYIYIYTHVHTYR